MFAFSQPRRTTLLRDLSPPPLSITYSSIVFCTHDNVPMLKWRVSIHLLPDKKHFRKVGLMVTDSRAFLAAASILRAMLELVGRRARYSAPGRRAEPLYT